MSINQILGCLFEITITSYNQTKINYKDEFEINEILKDKILKKTKKDSIEIGTRKIKNQPNIKTCI